MGIAGAFNTHPRRPRSEPLHRRLLGLILVSLFSEISYALVTGFALPLYLSDTLRYRTEAIGPILSAFLLTETLAKPLFGLWSDRVGRRPMIVSGILVSGVAVGMMAASHSYTAFLALSALNGLGGAMVWPSVFSALADVTSEEERVGAMSAFNMMYMIGLGLSPQAGGLAFRLAGTRPHLVFIATSAIFAVALLAAMTRAPGGEPKPARAANPGTTPRHPPIPNLAFFMSMTFLQTLALQFLTGAIILYVNKDLGLEPRNIGWPFLALAAMVAAAAVPVGVLGGRWGCVKSVRLGLLLAGVGMLLLPLRPTVAWWLIVAVPMIVGFLLSVPAWLALVTDLAPSAARGRVFGYVASAQGAGAILGPTAGLYLFGRVGHAAPFYASGTVLLLTFIGAMLSLRGREWATSGATTGS